MANVVYPKYKEALLGAAANVSLNDSEGTTGVFAALIDTGTYTYDAAHDFYNDLSGIVGTDQEITSKTIVDGLFDGDNCVFPSVSGSSAEAIVIYRKNAGANSSWRLIAYLDTGVSGLPVTPNGTNININWNASGIVQL
jgi:hypothetical protein